MVKAPPHPAYMTASSPTWRERERSEGVEYTPNMADPTKAIEIMYRISSLSAPPVQIPLGKDSLAMVRGMVASLQQTIENYASLSDELVPKGEYWESFAR